MISHCPFGMYNTIIHHSTPNLTMGAVPQVISPLLLMLPAEFCRVEEVYHILRSLKLVLIRFIEDLLHCKVRSFF